MEQTVILARRELGNIPSNPLGKVFEDGASNTLPV